MREPNNKPFQPLGGHLKYLRELSHQSLAEVSGAVEIDEAELFRAFPSGDERQSVVAADLVVNVRPDRLRRLGDFAGGAFLQMSKDRRGHSITQGKAFEDGERVGERGGIRGGGA